MHGTIDRDPHQANERTAGRRISEGLMGLFAGIIGLILAAQAFLIIFFIPSIIYKNGDIMMSWGWIAPIPGLIVGHGLAKAAYSLVWRSLNHAVKSQSNRIFKLMAVIGLAVCLVAGVYQAMTTYGDVKVSWQEEVQLMDGRSIIAQRTAMGNVAALPESQIRDWAPQEYTIQIPGITKTHVWKNSSRPLLLDQNPKTGAWFILTKAFNCTITRYQLYVLQADGWVESPMDQTQVGREPNLLLHPLLNGEHKQVDIKERHDRNNAEARTPVRLNDQCNEDA